MRLLIVEDNGLVALGLKMLLTDLGYRVVGASVDQARAIELAERHRPDLALVDINLGRGGCGIEVIRVLRERWGIPSLTLSADHAAAHEVRDMVLGTIDKPVTPDALIAALEAAEIRVRELGARSSPVPA